ncbi:MarR family winged helix-turn-helix transcriptional regulator [Arcobacter sp. CECT 8985]|uniref:MarR family winged helix-turn-helix transcriptional regulator n=1 Tax=Arcobacter sp. CECT 8985 TaxID=1935424 RepID=UPI002159E790|nr:MarR family transcriptional regulator [Arcobacter sp. CECT 8985]
MSCEQLKLDNQICFPIYALSRLITSEYKPLLEKLELTYPQYLVMLLLWETDGLLVSEIGKKLFLNTNTITPLLKRMESNGLLTRERNKEDERKVIVKLTKKGHELELEASKIPEKLFSKFDKSEIKKESLIEFRSTLNLLINHLNKNK